jgi:hypothetical protein
MYSMTVLLFLVSIAGNLAIPLSKHTSFTRCYAQRDLLERGKVKSNNDIYFCMLLPKDYLK